jgi:hypothetical protein
MQEKTGNCGRLGVNMKKVACNSKKNTAMQAFASFTANKILPAKAIMEYPAVNFCNSVLNLSK